MPPPPERRPEHPANLAPRAEILNDSTGARQALLDGIIRNVKKKEDLHDTPKQTLQTLFIQDRHEGNNTFSGNFSAFGNKNFEKWAGLRDLVPDGYTSVRVTRPNGEIIEGERRPNGSFYTSDGKYVAIWTGDSFSATREAPQRSAQELLPSPTSPESVNQRLPEVSRNKTLYIGDSRMVGVKGVAHGAEGLAITGASTARILENLQRQPASFFEGKERAVLFSGINGIDQTVPELIIPMQDMVQFLREHNVSSIVVCTLPPWDESHDAKIRAYNDALRAIPGIQIIDLYAEMANNPRYPWARDRLHLRDYRPLAQYIETQANIRMG